MKFSLATSLILSVVHLVQGWHKLYKNPSGSAPSCQRDSDCDVVGLGQTCLWLYEGCDNGQCRCDPVRTVQRSTGQCFPVRLGHERCRSSDACREGMHCSGGVCHCKEGTMTTDRLHCLQRRERLLGQACHPAADTCLQIDGTGYTRNNVGCSNEGRCVCLDGVKTDRHTCRPWRLHERGCSKLYHCTGGAVCVDQRCVCPEGYTGAAGGTKCVLRTAVRDLPVGSECDEINDRQYCAQGLVCHRCSEQSAFRCVRFSMPKEMARFGASDSSPFRSTLSLSLLVLALTTFTLVESLR